MGEGGNSGRRRTLRGKENLVRNSFTHTGGYCKGRFPSCGSRIHLLTQGGEGSKSEFKGKGL